MEEEKSEKVTVEKREKWRKSIDFFFNIFGAAVGLGNIWRFPYLCYRNGGGVFLIAYLCLMLVFVFPLIVVEAAVGQLTGRSSVKSWGIVAPIFKGIGNATPLLQGYSNMYYAVIMAWALRWFVASFSSTMPWTTCGNKWNTENCTEITRMFSNISTEEENATIPHVHDNTTKLLRNSPIEEFWRYNILGMTSGLEEPGEVRLDLLGCLFAIWVLTFFTIWKGIGWTSKIVYVTATLPLIMMLVVTVRGLTLKGAGEGISFYLKTDAKKLVNAEVWRDAASQVLFTVGACGGVTATLSGYNKYNHNFFRDLIIVVCCNALASFLAGFAIFSVLGFLAQAQNATVDKVAESGPGLVFVIYPTALSLLPLPQLWSALFFLMVILLGFDTLFVSQETIHACLADMFPRFHRRKYAREFAVAVFSLVELLLGISMVTGGGIYVLHIISEYGSIGWCMFFFGLCELVAVGWVFGADKMLQSIQQMLGYSIPKLWFKLCWKYLGPVTAAVVMIYSLVQYKPLDYDKTYIYPTWANVFAWMLALSSVLLIPGCAAYVIWKSKGSTLKEKLWIALRPTCDDVGNRKINIREENETKSLSAEEKV